ncbi:MULTISPECIES: response regulator [Leptolyngbya]|jgi:twitching motility two-component system response regulator PilH|uniref:Response regulator receiver protein n=2 Tax=Leptolyngbya boryana TaxID=1184 RepID=A0A1Z4JKC4_LEPBY|nr:MULTISPECIES: response regulator [Leptolyngbya]BAY57037.1 response regulator receiver protein [Leptolyngbya boryana NIES-2135]MBD1857185.1 response regulator [Leptolyngbya sp. FACHB-1624]MBD2367206.1 response regulator [Leptolyngbya sp. FACHB-161]MBD2373440.1 response regulator [Leptolyngbya sp. FACHB-238]MBD2397849.1 response regulator [Leptolyngbya sp. FACHB-239]
MSWVLVVDDSAVVRELISTELRHQGFDVAVANDGVDAISVIQKHPPDLVITDVVMPRMNGYELCRWIKSDPRSQNIPVMICSIKGEDFDRYWGMKQGADAYMIKPCPPAEMLSAIDYLLSRSATSN